jgi:hypothetical protein
VGQRVLVIGWDGADREIVDDLGSTVGEVTARERDETSRHLRDLRCIE